LTAAGALLATPLARAQQPGRTYRVAIVLSTSALSEMAGPNPEHPPTRNILHELRSLGYVEGRNLVFERRSAEGDPKRYKGIIDELIGLKTDVMILAPISALLRTAQSTTRTVLIVQMGYPRLVEEGFAASLARPGGNITGPATVDWAEVLAKGLQLFKETVSRLSRVAVVTNWWEVPAWQRVRDALRDAAAAMGIELVPVDLHRTDPRATFAAIAKVRVDGLLIPGGPIPYGQREDLGRLALAAGLPTASEVTRITETGGLMSYGGDAMENFRAIARYVDKILKGARPGDLPAERPTKFELVINMKTAKALGITVPQSILLRADRVIE
jgi:putative ABC transport system substrate-binding protein